jgi:hypothetical protein
MTNCWFTAKAYADVIKQAAEKGAEISFIHLQLLTAFIYHLYAVALNAGYASNVVGLL